MILPLPADASMPRIVHENGRYALFVDGAPYLMLGAQVNNSSAWPATMPKVWPTMGKLGVNTVEVPIYWEQFEPRPGVFDPSIIDLLLRQARERKDRLVLLWFGTWKNGSGHYWPEWMKRDGKRYPRMTGADGRTIDSPSPHAPATLEADVRGFTALMTHLKRADARHTVIMVQVENEPGTWGGVRDFSPAAEALFRSPVPAALTAALGKPAGGDWPTTFGPDADETFHAWSVASYIGKVAAAGKRAYPLPLYVNAALRDPLRPTRPPRYESGGPTDNVLEVWKVAAPAVDLLAPDIYQNDEASYRKILDLYARRDNPLFVPETGRNAANARYLFAVLGKGGIGFSPFGVDDVERRDETSLPTFALEYHVLASMAREIARWNLDGRLQAVAEATGRPSETLAFGKWNAIVSYGRSRGDGPPPGNPSPIGRALVAQTGPDEFMVTGLASRVDFRPMAGGTRQWLRVKEGAYLNGRFVATRIWNGDQTDWGLNFPDDAMPVLRVSLLTP